jgi:hypothetical protein
MVWLITLSDLVPSGENHNCLRRKIGFHYEMIITAWGQLHLPSYDVSLQGSLFLEFEIIWEGLERELTRGTK